MVTPHTSMAVQLPVAVVTVHGMGTHTKGHDKTFIDEMTSRFGEGEIVMESCVWSDVTTKHQEEMMRRTVDAGRFLKTRQFVLSGLGDATSYLGGFFSMHNVNQPCVYREVHEELAKTLESIESKLVARGLNPEHVPLMVIAHSLGSTIVSNYIWDLSKPNSYFASRSPFVQMKTLTSLITYGSTLPLFIPKPTGQGRITCIDFPPGNRFEKIAHWDNIYSPFDILGWPIEKLWDRIPSKGPRDIRMLVGRPLLKRYTPLTHEHYTSSRNFTKYIESQLAGALRYARSIAGS